MMKAILIHCQNTIAILRVTVTVTMVTAPTEHQMTIVQRPVMTTTMMMKHKRAGILVFNKSGVWLGAAS